MRNEPVLYGVISVMSGISRNNGKENFAKFCESGCKSVHFSKSVSGTQPCSCVREANNILVQSLC